MTSLGIHLNHREHSILQAVADGRAEMSCSSEPDLFIDGIACCDQFTAHWLARLNLVRPQHIGRPADRVPALVTDTALRALALSPAPVNAA